MIFILFSNKKGFLSSTLNGGTWDKNPEKALLRKSANETDTELATIAEKNKEHAKWIKQNEVRKLSYGEALYQLCTIIGNTKKTQAALDALHRITGVTWHKTTDGLWQSANLKLDKNSLSAHIIQNALSKDDIAEILDSISLIDYWTDNTRYIYSTPAKEVVIYRAAAQKLLSQLSSITEGFVSSSKSKDSKFNGDVIYSKIEELRQAVDCTQQHQINKF